MQPRTIERNEYVVYETIYEMNHYSLFRDTTCRDGRSSNWIQSIQPSLISFFTFQSLDPIQYTALGIDR